MGTEERGKEMMGLMRGRYGKMRGKGKRAEG